MNFRRDVLLQNLSQPVGGFHQRCGRSGAGGTFPSLDLSCSFPGVGHVHDVFLVSDAMLHAADTAWESSFRIHFQA